MGAQESDHKDLFHRAPEPTVPEGTPWDQFRSDGTWDQPATEMIEKLASKFAHRTFLERAGGYLEPTDAHLRMVIGEDAQLLSHETLEMVRLAYNTIYPRKSRKKITASQHRASRK